jgi:hypothetical protein
LYQEKSGNPAPPQKKVKTKLIINEEQNVAQALINQEKSWAQKQSFFSSTNVEVMMNGSA